MEAALDLLFLYRLGKDKTDVPFPRDKGSSEKLKMRDNMLEVQYLSHNFSISKRGFSSIFIMVNSSTSNSQKGCKSYPNSELYAR